MNPRQKETEVVLTNTSGFRPCRYSFDDVERGTVRLFGARCHKKEHEGDHRNRQIDCLGEWSRAH